VSSQQSSGSRVARHVQGAQRCRYYAIENLGVAACWWSQCCFSASPSCQPLGPAPKATSSISSREARSRQSGTTARARRPARISGTGSEVSRLFESRPNTHDNDIRPLCRSSPHFSVPTRRHVVLRLGSSWRRDSPPPGQIRDEADASAATRPNQPCRIGLFRPSLRYEQTGLG
jgi:hypothetical protein